MAPCKPVRKIPPGSQENRDFYRNEEVRPLLTAAPICTRHHTEKHKGNIEKYGSSYTLTNVQGGRGGDREGGQ